MIRIEDVPHEFRELHDGRVIVLTDLNFLAENIDSYETRTHRVITCPVCYSNHINDGELTYTKKKLYLHRESDGTFDKGFCHRCKSAFFDSNPELVFRVNSIRTEMPLTARSLSKSVGGYLRYYSEMADDEEKRNELKLQLRKRNSGMVVNHIEELHIIGDNDKVIFPFIVGEKLIYWQLRHFHYSISQPKYYMPPIDNKPLYMPIIKSKSIVVCEGVFDAIACLDLFPEFTPVALLGSYVTDYHLWMIRKFIRPSYALIFMDDIDLSYGIRRRLKNNIKSLVGCDIFKLANGVDPDDYLNINIINSVEGLDNFHNIISNHYESRLRL